MVSSCRRVPGMALRAGNRFTRRFASPCRGVWQNGLRFCVVLVPSHRRPTRIHPIPPDGVPRRNRGLTRTDWALTQAHHTGVSTHVAVKIRLKRLGKIRSPHYRIVVADSRTKRDGRAIEEIGKYHPKNDPSVIEVNSERAQYWLSVGAQPTEAVVALFKRTGDWQKFSGDTSPVRASSRRRRSGQARRLQRGAGRGGQRARRAPPSRASRKRSSRQRGHPGRGPEAATPEPRARPEHAGRRAGAPGAGHRLASRRRRGSGTRTCAGPDARGAGQPVRHRQGDRPFRAARPPRCGRWSARSPVGSRSGSTSSTSTSRARPAVADRHHG